MRKLIAFVALLVCSAVQADTLYVTEFAGPPSVSVYYQAASTPAVASQTVAIAASSAQSAAFNASTYLVRVHTDVDCHVVVGGTSPTATVSSMRMVAGQTEYFVVVPGQRVAVIAAAP